MCCRYACLMYRCLAECEIFPTARLIPPQPSLVLWVFLPPCLPFSLPARRPGGNGRQIMPGWFTAVWASPSTHRTFMGIPVIAKPQAPEGKVQVKERCLLSQQAWTERRSISVCGRSLVLGVLAEKCFKRGRVFQQELPKTVVCSALTQLSKLGLSKG